MSTVATLMENGVPVSTDPKSEHLTMLFEGMKDWEAWLVASLRGGLMKMKAGFESTMKAGKDEFTVYRDPDTGDYYYIDDNGDEVDCDQHETHWVNKMEDEYDGIDEEDGISSGETWI